MMALSIPSRLDLPCAGGVVGQPSALLDCWEEMHAAAIEYDAARRDVLR